MDLLYLALRNVLGNAVKFTQPGDAIQVRAFEGTNHIVVEVADDGPGISQEELPHITEELYRGKNARGLPGAYWAWLWSRPLWSGMAVRSPCAARGSGTVVALSLPRA